MRKPVAVIVCLLTGWLVAQAWLLAPVTTAWSQDKSKSKTSKKKGNTSVLDVKANGIQGEFIKSAEELAGEYYDLKEFDKARMLLKSIQALDPDRPNLAAKLKLLDEDMINSNETEFEVNTAKGWESTQVVAFAGKPIRLKAEGNYKFVTSATLSPSGFPSSKEPNQIDLLPELPVGALIGIIIPAERPQAGKVDDKKRERPFLIGEGCDYTAQKDGVLYLRVNAPPDNKNTGKIKVQISGGTRLGK